MPQRIFIRRHTFTLALLVLLCFPTAGYTRNETVTLSSLEWPPFAGSALPGQGRSIDITRRAFASVGISLKIRFYPWKRAMVLAHTESPIQGILPSYYSKERSQKFVFSDPIGYSPVGFIEHVDHPIHWNTLQDLRPYVIGTVNGFVNTAEFDDLARRGILKTAPVVSDMINIRKVAAGRIPLAVIDIHVFKNIVSNERSLREEAAKVRLNERILENKALHACFRKTKEGRRLAAALDKGLRNIAGSVPDAQDSKKKAASTRGNHEAIEWHSLTIKSAR